MMNKELILKIYEEDLEDLPILKRNAAENDSNGHSSGMLGQTYRDLALGGVLLNIQKSQYVEYLHKSSQIALEILKRFDNGEPISKSFVSILCYKELFDALATGDMGLSQEYAEFLGGRPEIEKEFDHPFDIALGYALKAIVLETEDVVARLAAFRDQLSKKGNKSFKGFVEAFEAIHHRDKYAFETGLNEIVRCYPHLRKGVFDHSLDAHLCVWGIGLINLAKHKGMVIEFDHELMPEKLQLD